MEYELAIEKNEVGLYVVKGRAHPYTLLSGKRAGSYDMNKYSHSY